MISTLFFGDSEPEALSGSHACRDGALFPACGSMSLKGSKHCPLFGFIIRDADVGWVPRLGCHLASREPNPWPTPEPTPASTCSTASHCGLSVCLSRPGGGGVAISQERRVDVSLPRPIPSGQILCRKSWHPGDSLAVTTALLSPALRD